MMTNSRRRVCQAAKHSFGDGVEDGAFHRVALHLSDAIVNVSRGEAAIASASQKRTIWILLRRKKSARDGSSGSFCSAR